MKPIKFKQLAQLLICDRYGYYTLRVACTGLKFISPTIKGYVLHDVVETTPGPAFLMQRFILDFKGENLFMESGIYAWHRIKYYKFKPCNKFVAFVPTKLVQMQSFSGDIKYTITQV